MKGNLHKLHFGNEKQVQLLHQDGKLIGLMH